MRWLMIVVFCWMVSLAQTTPLLLPMSNTGTGTSQTQTFIATTSWKFNAQSSSVVIVYLYDATQGQFLRTVVNNEIISDTGSFFLYINAPDASWQITVENAAASTIAMPPTVPVITPPVAPTTPTISTEPTTPTNAEPTSAEPTSAEPTPTTPATPTPEPTAPVVPTTTAPTTPAQPAPTTNTAATLSQITIEAMSRVSADDLKRWGKHFGHGIPRYNRTAGSLNEAVCSSFANVFDAQKALLDAGGPDSDIQNLDPDGDGYACSYNPIETYTPPRTCGEGKEWINGFYKKDGSFRPSGCRNKK
jgi:hypothetical protein